MTDEETHAFEAKYGYPPTAYKIALDALAVYANRDNPIRQITLQQLDGMYSSTRRKGGVAIDTWGALGLTGDWATRNIELFGRDAKSGTHDFFRQHVLDNGDFRQTVHEDLSQEVVQDVAEHQNGVGYSGIGWKTSNVRTVALGNSAQEFFEPTYEDSLSGRYPLARFLYIYVNQPPGKPLEGAAGEFIKYVRSYEGQETVVEAKFFPLPAKIVAEAAARR
jgi:phosphate transport system substrate-binding protein